jgi:hypothetical protein
MLIRNINYIRYRILLYSTVFRNTILYRKREGIANNTTLFGKPHGNIRLDLSECSRVKCVFRERIQDQPSQDRVERGSRSVTTFGDHK